MAYIIKGSFFYYKNFFSLIFLLYFFSFTTCSTSNLKLNYNEDHVSIMAYNVENLFDTQHDEGTEDTTYLPLSLKKSRDHISQCNGIKHDKYRDECLNMDWNENILQRKMKRLADVILQVNSGKGPDILILEEVENIRVLNQLADKFLSNANYRTRVLIEGFDKRGIDVAILSRLEEISPAKLHKIPYKGKTEDDQTWMDRSRGILQANLKLPDGTKLAVFGIHFPSGGNPTYWRQQSIQYLNSLIENIPSDTLAIAGGDFNINSEEDGTHSLYKKEIGNKWLVSHLEGCQDCKGTNYYHTKKQWSFLDALLFHKAFDPQGNSNWTLIKESIQIPNESVYQKNRFMSPARFEENSPVGVSDHWPIFAIIKPKKPILSDKK